jgi:hypothetical protein
MYLKKHLIRQRQQYYNSPKIILENQPWLMFVNLNFYKPGLSDKLQNSGDVLKDRAIQPLLFILLTMLNPWTDVVQNSGLFYIIRCACTSAFRSSFKLPNRQPDMKNRRHNS